MHKYVYQNDNFVLPGLHPKDIPNTVTVASGANLHGAKASYPVLSILG